MLPSSSSCLARLSTMGIEDSNSALGHTRGGCANASAAASKIIAVANVASTEYLTIVRISGTSGSCAFGACIWRAFQLPSLRTSVPPSVRRWIARRNVQACRLAMMPWLFFCIEPNSLCISGSHYLIVRRAFSTAASASASTDRPGVLLANLSEGRSLLLESVNNARGYVP